MCSILKLKSANLNIFVRPAQNQGSSLDCGLFAIANMYCIASGKDPTTINSRQQLMRSHLLKCIRNGVMEDFPITVSLVSRVRPKDCVYAVHCLCRQPLLRAGTAGTIQCAGCKSLFHEKCLVKKPTSDIQFICSQGYIAGEIQKRLRLS